MTDTLDRPVLSRRQFAGASAAGLALAGAAPTAFAAGDVVETDVVVPTQDGQADAALFHPAGKGKWPAVVVFADALGLRPEFREMGRRLAAEGYVVLVPNPFYRTRKAPVLEGPFDFANPADRAKLAELTKPLNADTTTRDGLAYLAFLDAQKVVDTRRKAGVVGYCMGGPYTMRAAAAAPGRVGAGCSFHGGGVVTDQPDSPHLLVPKMKASFYFGIAANDDQRQPDQKDKLKAAFAAAGLPATVVVYDGCQHGWCVKGMPVYNEAGAERAWAEMVKLYKQTLA